MRHVLGIPVLCILLGAATAHAQSGVNLSWDDCGAFGVANQSFACDTNADSTTLVASFVVGVGGLCFADVHAIIDLQVATGSLPNWWQFKNPGSCREKSLRAKADFPWPPAPCVDPLGGCGTPGLAWYSVGEGGPNRARIHTSYSTPCTMCFPLEAGVEYYAIKLVIRHDQTTGPGSCDGCEAAACIVLNTVHVYTTNLPPWDHLEVSGQLQRNYVTWQGGTVDCPASTPTLNRTWGALKSAYR